MDAAVTGGNITPPLKRSARARAPYYLIGRPLLPPSTPVSAPDALSRVFSFGSNNAERSGSGRSCISRQNTPKQARPQMPDHPSSITHGQRRERLGGDTELLLFFFFFTQEHCGSVWPMCCGRSSPYSANKGDSPDWSRARKQDY